MTTSDLQVLDEPAWAALHGPHAHLAVRRGAAVRYPDDMSPFAAVAPGFPEGAWDDLAALAGPDGVIAVAGDMAEPPAGWEVVRRGTGVQMVAANVPARPDGDLVRLGPADVPEMLALVERTQPGPFRPRTIELGAYLGVRRAGELVAMAGERVHPPGWTEISAVCTDAAVRGRGLATRLVLSVAAGIEERGERPFLHAAATNTNAIRLYEQLGFVVRTRTTFQRLRAPSKGAARA